MSALSELQNHLTRYWALPYHQDAALEAKLVEVQAWQRARIQRTHNELFEQPKNRPMADYFLTQLYGGGEFKLLAKQLERILPKAKKLERLAKETVLAYSHNFQPMYDFIDAGFKAMKPLDSVGGFIEPFCKRELLIIDQIHATANQGKVAAFAVS